MMIYLDNAATTPVREEVVEVIADTLKNNFGNPSSTYLIGKQSKRLIENARESIGKQLGVLAKSIYFTSGATEANNWAIQSQAMKAKELGKGHHIVMSAVEHPSVMEMANQLTTQGFDISFVFPNEEHVVTVDAFIQLTTEHTTGWIAMAVNNETGALLPIAALAKEAKRRALWCHVDAVQAVGYLTERILHDATSISLAGHKINAPKGIGVLIYQPHDLKMTLNPLIVGGGQERQRRSGTENIAYIKGFEKALTLYIEELNQNMHHYLELEHYLITQLNEIGIEYELNANPKYKVPYITNIWLKNQLASRVLIQMDLNHIYISAGSACSAGSVSESKILKAFYPTTPNRWRESIRISFGYQTTKEDIAQFVSRLKASIK